MPCCWGRCRCRSGLGGSESALVCTLSGDVGSWDSSVFSATDRGGRVTWGAEEPPTCTHWWACSTWSDAAEHCAGRAHARQAASSGARPPAAGAGALAGAAGAGLGSGPGALRVRAQGCGLQMPLPPRPSRTPARGHHGQQCRQLGGVVPFCLPKRPEGVRVSHVGRQAERGEAACPGLVQGSSLAGPPTHLPLSGPSSPLPPTWVRAGTGEGRRVEALTWGQAWP